MSLVEGQGFTDGSHSNSFGWDGSDDGFQLMAMLCKDI